MEECGTLRRSCYRSGAFIFDALHVEIGCVMTQDDEDGIVGAEGQT